jgi:hypothetical protein
MGILVQLFDALKRDGGFATQDAAKNAGRADAKKIKYEPIMAIYGFLS